MVWLIIAGPAVVVVAGFVTLYLAISIPDPVLPTEAGAGEYVSARSELTGATRAMRLVQTPLAPSP